MGWRLIWYIFYPDGSWRVMNQVMEKWQSIRSAVQHKIDGR